MDTQGSLISKQPAESRIDVPDEASKDNPKRILHGKYRRIRKIESTEGSKESRIDVPDEASKDNPKRILYGEYQRIRKIESTEGSKVQLKVKVNGDYRQLFEAAVKGDWEVAEKILDEDLSAMTAKVMTVQKESFATLEVAITASQDQFVENLVKRLPRGYDAERTLAYAVQGGRIRMVKALVSKVGTAPKDVLRRACFHAPMEKEVISYLATLTTSAPSFSTMSNLVIAGHLDICVYLAGRYPDMVESQNEENWNLFRLLANTNSSFRSGARLNFWEKRIYKCIPMCLIDTSVDNSQHKMMARALMQFKISLWNIVSKSAPFIKRIGELKLKHKWALKFAKLALPEKKKTNVKSPEILQFTSRIVLQAASLGIFEIVKLCLKTFPELIWDKDFTKELVKTVVEKRHVELFRLLNGHLSEGFLTKQDMMMRQINWSPICESPNDSGAEGLIHWSPICESPEDFGAAFFLQRELQWFDVVEGKTAPSLRSLQSSKKTFIDHRKDLLKEARQWMKDTSSSCSVVATLIITVTFAAAYTVPGGNDSSTGTPIFLKKGSFMVFAVADSLALFSSVAATLMFLTILTSRYAIDDFLYSLPRKMITGLTFLFLSLAFMSVAFGSALTIVLSERLKWIYIPVTLLAAFPVVMFAILQLPLYVEMAESTFWPRLYRPLKLWK